MINNIVFDIGNVLADFRLMEFLAGKGLDTATSKRILKASVMSPYWEQFERAAITEAEALQRFASLDPEIENELYTAYSNINGMLTVRDFSLSWIKGLKESGYKVYYLSNYSKKAYDECSDSLTFLPYMDGGLLSFQAKMTKPDPNFYKCFLDQFHLAAKECVFIDDTKENVVAAIDLGFEGIVFESYEDTVTQLARLGVKA